MKLKEIHIKDIGGIRELFLSNLNDSVNVLTGTNGVGKTTILKSIAAILTGTENSSLKKNALSEYGEISGKLADNNGERDAVLRIEKFKPEDQEYKRGFYVGQNVIYISDNRDFEYKRLPNIPPDNVRNEFYLNDNILTALNRDEIKGWFVNRYLFSAHKDALTAQQRENFNSAIESFSIFDADISFAKVESSSLDILVDTPTGRIYYEYLSSGYKSILTLILGIIKEIEFRFREEGVTAKTFDGIILIDEIDLHLHPTWQTQIIGSLVNIFPNAQFFVTTHSPHVVQSLEPDQLIALRKNGGNVEEMPGSDSPFGYRGWTIEEILTNVLGMESIDTETFLSIWVSFTKAVSHDKKEDAFAWAAELKKILHPSNPLLKIIALQLTRFADYDTSDKK